MSSKILLHIDFAQLLRLVYVTFFLFPAAQSLKCIAASFLRVQPCFSRCRARPAACLPIRMRFTLALLCMQNLFAYVAIALLATSASARTLTQSTYTDADIYNFALNLEYLEVRFSLSTALQLLPFI